jgi:hypothetical protein
MLTTDTLSLTGQPRQGRNIGSINSNPGIENVP